MIKNFEKEGSHEDQINWWQTISTFAKDIKQLLARRQILVDHIPAQKLSQASTLDLTDSNRGIGSFRTRITTTTCSINQSGPWLPKTTHHQRWSISGPPARVPRHIILLVASISDTVVCSSSQIMVPSQLLHPPIPCGEGLWGRKSMVHSMQPHIRAFQNGFHSEQPICKPASWPF